MENQKKSTGEGTGVSSIKFIKNKLIVNAIRNNIPKDVIRKFYKTTYRRIEYLEYTLGLLYKNNIHFGYKNESYYTEEELLQGIPQYKWEDLSEEEKEFYNNYKEK